MISLSHLSLSFLSTFNVLQTITPLTMVCTRPNTHPFLFPPLRLQMLFLVLLKLRTSLEVALAAWELELHSYHGGGENIYNVFILWMHILKLLRQMQ
jgi:hypothetical protein